MRFGRLRVAIQSSSQHRACGRTIPLEELTLPRHHYRAPVAVLLAVVVIASSRPGPRLHARPGAPAGCDLARPRSTVILGQCIIAGTADGTIGGLSGAYFENQFLWAVTDSRTQSHLLRFALSLDPNRTESALTIESPPRAVALRRHPAPGGDAIIQAEAMARTDVFWVATEETPPGLFRCDAGTGNCDASVRLPPSFKDMDPRRGIEGLASSPSGGRLVAALEGPRRSSPEAENHWTRLATFDTGAAGGVPTAMREYLYPVDWITQDATDEGIGVSDVLFITEDELLVLERGYFARCGNTVRLYRVRLAEASAISTGGSLPAPLTKRLVFDLRDFSPHLADLRRFGSLWRGKLREKLENFEALTWGPPLPNGTRTLLLVSDDNFKRAGSESQVTAVLALRWSALWNDGPVQSSRFATGPRCP